MNAASMLHQICRCAANPSPARRRYCLLVQYLALGGRHFSEERLRDFGPFHLLLDLVVDGGVDVEDGALRLPVPLAGQRRGLHLAWGGGTNVCDTI